MNRVALYARVSTRDQETANQLEQLREFCRTQGWTISHEYIDHASGSRSDREQFQQMFADASNRKFDSVLMWSLDRFSREGVLSTLQYLQALTAYGVGWKSFTEQYLDSVGPFRDAVLAILATIAKQERIRISERTKAGLEIARSRGKSIGRPKVAVDSENIQSLRSRGLSWQQIALQTGRTRSTCRRAIQ
jgi:DNA invertase Pin-like site-specific DNA recombinase